MQSIARSSAERERLEQAARAPETSGRGSACAPCCSGMNATTPARSAVSANRVYQSVQGQAGAFVNHLLSMSNPQVLQTAGCPSASFWLTS